MSDIYTSAKSLVLALSDDCEDYPDMASYRMVMDRCRDVKHALYEHETREAEMKELTDKRNNLDDERRRIIEREWENCDLDLPRGAEVESDGWEHDGRNHFSRVYYISVWGETSTKHTFSITFADGSTEMVHSGR